MSSSHPTDDQSAGGDAPGTAPCRRRAVRLRAIPSSDPGWPELDASLLEDRRAPVPPFPLHVLPQPVARLGEADTARSTGAPADYVAQAVLGAAAGLCGAGAAVQVTPGWAEPLVLWQALIGASSSGKSPALASVRHLLTTIEGEQAARRSRRRFRTLIADVALDAVAKAVTANPRGVLLWRDEPAPWFAELLPAAPGGKHGPPTRSPSPMPGQRGSSRGFPSASWPRCSTTRCRRCSSRPTMDLAARLLYGWPDLPPYCPLAERKPARDDQALAMLRRIARKARTPDDPLVLVVDAQGQQGIRRLSRPPARPRGARPKGIEAGWLGKGGGTVARLAGIIEAARVVWLGLVRSAGTYRPRPGGGRRRAVERLFPAARPRRVRSRDTDNFRGSRRAARVARWLKDSGATVVSREDIRCAGAGPGRSAAGRCPTGALSSGTPRLRPPRIVPTITRDPAGRRGGGRSIRPWPTS